MRSAPGCVRCNAAEVEHPRQHLPALPRAGQSRSNHLALGNEEGKAMERFRQIWWVASFGTALPVAGVLALLFLPDRPPLAAIAGAAWLGFVVVADRALLAVARSRYRGRAAART